MEILSGVTELNDASLYITQPAVVVRSAKYTPNYIKNIENFVVTLG